MSKPNTAPEPLRSWGALNTYLMGSSEDDAKRLLAQEVGGRKRAQFVLRIHSRINKLRADRERSELDSGIISTGLIATVNRPAPSGKATNNDKK